MLFQAGALALYQRLLEKEKTEAPWSTCFGDTNDLL